MNPNSTGLDNATGPRLVLEMREVRIPFRFRYGHARKSHRGLSAVICLARDEAGRIGLGEAVPRTYVSGETCDSVWAALPRLVGSEEFGATREALASGRLERARQWPGPFPSCAACALDTALCDLYAQRHGQPLAAYLADAPRERLEYAASIGVSGKTRLTALLLLYRAMGLNHFKVKVGDEEDVERVAYIRRLLGSAVRLFADANAHWDEDTAARRIEAFARHGVWAVEEPLRAAEPAPGPDGQLDRLAVLDDRHYQRCRRLRQRSSLPLIADESLICWHSFERLRDHQAFDILNIRLSKLGGPLLAGEMVREARRSGLRFAIGAMVGETPVLATAGAHFGAAYGDHEYIQGHSHRLLHGVRFVRGEPRLRRGGRLQLGTQPGLALRLDAARLDRLTIRKEVFTS